MGFEPATFWTQGTKLTTEPPSPTYLDLVTFPYLDVCLVLQDIDVECVALLNDTVGCLMSCAFKDHNTRVGIILGEKQINEQQ